VIFQIIVAVCRVTKRVYEGTGKSVGPENLKVGVSSFLGKIFKYIIEAKDIEVKVGLLL